MHTEQAAETASSARTRIVIITAAFIGALVIALLPLVLATQSSPDEQEAAPDPAGMAAHSREAESTGAASHRNNQNPQPARSVEELTLPCLTAPRLACSSAASAQQPLPQQWKGKPTVVNVWAWWCGPCREELPAVQALRNHRRDWNVVGVHLDSNAEAGRALLKDLRVTGLPSYQDSAHGFDRALALPRVVPLTVVFRADGTSAGVLADVFTSRAEIERAVEKVLAQ